MKKTILENNSNIQLSLIFNVNFKVALCMDDTVNEMYSNAYEFDNKEDLEDLIKMLEDYRDNFDWRMHKGEDL